MKPAFLVLFASALALVTGCAALQLTTIKTAQEKPSNVAIYFKVQTETGEPVGGLTAERFHIYEDAQLVSIYESKQTILNPEVAAAHYTLLLVDMSGSISDSGAVETLVQAVGTFTDRVEKQQKVGIYAFDGEADLHPIVPFTDQPGSARAGVSELATFRPKDPSTNLNGAIVNALAQLDAALARTTQPLKFGTLVVFTDGTDRANRVPTAEMEKHIHDTPTEVFAIGLGAEIKASELEAIGKNGTAMAADKTAIVKAFDEVGAKVEGETRSFYLLSYCSPSRAGKHQVRIEATAKDEKGNVERTGSVTSDFDATGFGPGCDPNTAPAFDVSKGDALKPPPPAPPGRAGPPQAQRHDRSREAEGRQEGHEGAAQSPRHASSVQAGLAPDHAGPGGASGVAAGPAARASAAGPGARTRAATRLQSLSRTPRDPMDRGELRERVERWIADDPDPATQDELRALLAVPDLATTDLEDRFAGALAFGTAGLRAVIGAGPNRMNRAVVARATWGLAEELRASVPDATERGVVVGGDARTMSRELAEDVAAILAAAGFRVVLFRHPVPTPLVGFVVKRTRAAAGVVITASHNPPEYNGYKAYWEDAAQIVSPVDQRIAAAIARAPAARAIARPDLSALRASGRVVDPAEDSARAYRAAIGALAVHPGEGDRTLRIVYTPLHGVGNVWMRAALDDAGFVAVTSVPEQAEPNAAFPTVAFPNPEEPGAMDLAFALASTTQASLVLANDPDADRLGVAVPERGPSGGYRRLTGNEVGVLLGYYLLTERATPTPSQSQSRLRAVVSSIVSSPLLGRIARDLGVHYEETLTGFKWIAHRAIDLDREGYEFVFGYEEALGYCVGNAVLDKDGISAGCLIAEFAAVLRGRGLTLADALDSIARRWGVYLSAQVNVTRKGAAGAAAIQAMMDGLRAHPPAFVGDDEVVAVADYATGWRRSWPPQPAEAASAETRLGLPASNVLAFELASGSRIIARPSGTEPKAKFYFDVCTQVSPGEAIAEAAARANGRLDALRVAFGGHLAERT